MSIRKTKVDLQAELMLAQQRIAELEAGASRPEPESYLRGLLNAMPDALFIVHSTGTILEANARAEEMFGYRRDEFLGVPVDFLLPLPVRAAHDGHRHRYLMHPSNLTAGVDREIRVLRQDGTEFPAEISLGHHRMPDGEAVVIATIRDVTQRVRAETLVAAQRDLARLSSADLPDETRWEAALAAVLQISGLDCGGIYIYNGETRIFELVYHTGLSQAFVETVRQFADGSPSARMLLSGQAAYFSESALSARPAHVAEGLHSLAALPIQRQGKILGCLNLGSHTLAELPAHARTALETLAVEIGHLFLQREYERSLRTNREQLEQTLVAARMGVWHYHLPSHRMEWSPEAARLFGADSQQDDLSGVLAHFHPDDQARMMSGLQEAFAQKRLMNAEYRIFGADGQLLWVTNYGRVECDAEGNPIAMSGLIQDITERKQAEETLRESEQSFARVFQSNPVAQLIISLVNGRILDANAAFCRQTGFLREEVVDRTTAALNLWHDPAQRQAVVTQLRAGAAVHDVELSLQTRAGDQRTFLFAFEPVELKGQACTVATGVDLTARIQAEQQLRDSEARFRSFMEQSADGFFLVDELGIMIEWNSALAHITGLEREAAVGRSMWEIQYQILTPERRQSLNLNRLKQAVDELLQSGQSALFGRPRDFEIQTIQGELRYVQQNSFSIPTRSGYRVGAVLRDVTERRRMEDALQAETVWRRTLFEEALEGILVIDPRTDRFVEFNTAAHRQLGYSRDEFAQLRVPELDAQDTPAVMQTRLAELNQTGKLEFETLQRTKQGDLRNIQVTAQRVELQGRPMYYCIWRDVTERRRVEAARRESDERYHLLFQSMVQGVVFQDSQGRIIQANPAAERILGVTIASLQGRTVFDSYWNTVYEDGSVFPAAAHPTTVALHTGRAVHNVVMGLQSPGLRATRWLNIAAVPRFREGEPQAYQVFTTFEDITDQKRAEHTLQDKLALQRQLETTAAAAPIMLHTFRRDAQGRFTMPYASPAIRSICGLEPDEVARDAESLLRRIEIADRSAVDEALAASLRQLGPWYSLFRLRNPQKGLRWLEAHSTPVQADDGSVLWHGVIEDVTDRKQAEDQLRASEEKYRGLVNNMNDTVWVFDATMHVLDVNNAATAVLGYTRQELLSMQATQIDSTLAREQLQQLVETMPHDRAQVFETAHRRKDGSEFPVEVSSSWMSYVDGRPVILSIARDITERKRAQADLLRLEQRYRAMIEYAPDGIVLLDQNGRFKYVSPSVRRIFGYDTRGILDLDPMALTHPDDLSRVLTELTALMADASRVPTLQYRFLHTNGDWRWIESTFSNLLALPGVEAVIINFRDIHERKLAEEEAQRSHTQLLRFASQVPGMLWQFERRPDGWFRVPFTTEAIRDIFDCSPEAVRNDLAPILRAIHPDDRSKVQTAVADSQRTMTPFQCEYRVSRPGQPERWLLAKSVPELMPDGCIVWSGFNTDITEQKTAEAALVQSQALLTEAQRIGRLGYMEWNRPDPELMCSDQVYDIFDLPRGTRVTQEVIASLMTPAESARVQALDVQQVRQRTDLDNEYCIRTPRGHERWIHQIGKVTYAADGSPQRMMIIVQDVTERHRTEAALRAEQMRLSRLADTVPGVITTFALDPQGSLAMTYASKAFEDVYGFPLEEGVDSLPAITRRVPPDQVASLIASVQKSAATLQPWRNEYEYDHPWKGQVWLEGFSMPVVEADGGIVWHGFVSDVTERKQAEDNLRASEDKYRRLSGELEERVRQRTAEVQVSRDRLSMANAALERAARLKDEFLASMSHELRTPLTGILGLSETLLLNTYGSLNPRQERALKSIEESGHHLLALINDILDLSKIEAGMLDLNIETVVLSDVCQSALQLTRGMAKKKRHQVSFSMTPPLLTVRGDTRRIKQMLVNLLSNAVKFTPDGGTLGLEVEASESEQVVSLTVWDRGIGIAPENLDRLFQPFVQLDSDLAREYEGSGLGLSLVQHMAELHGGSVAVVSTPGMGSRFTIRLPWTPSTSPADVSAAAEPSWLRTALLIEANETDAAQLSRYLRILGIESSTQPLGTGAVEVAARLQPGVIVLDLKMPDVPGLETLALLKADPRTQAIPIVICSVLEMRTRAMELGAAGYVIKPVVYTDLREELMHCTARVGGQGTLGRIAQTPRVMLVDDNDTFLSLVSDYLSSQGFVLHLARSGTEFLDIVAGWRPDVVLMDVQMPGMDGMETTQRLRQHADPAIAGIPVIAVTALAMMGDRDRCLAAGANEYLSKPVRLPDLVGLIWKLHRERT